MAYAHCKNMSARLHTAPSFMGRMLHFHCGEASSSLAGATNYFATFAA